MVSELSSCRPLPSSGDLQPSDAACAGTGAGTPGAAKGVKGQWRGRSTGYGVHKHSHDTPPDAHRSNTKAPFLVGHPGSSA